MTQERKPKILTRLRIDEVSAVDRGAGEGVKVVLMKRDDGADNRPAERPSLTDVFLGRQTARDYLAKSYAADAREADLRDEETPADELVGGDEHHASKVADLLIESGSHPDRSQALAWLLHHKDGVALLRRLNKSEDPNTMSLDLSAVVKAHGISALCRHMIKSESAFGIDEHQLVALATEDAARRYPDVSPSQAFAKLFLESRELQQAVEISKAAVLQDAVAEAAEKDSRAACEELASIGKSRWPGLTRAQQFARAAETNPAILARAHRRPGSSTSFPQPVTKALPTVLNVSDIMPVTSTETDPNDAANALAQLKQIARDKWPNETEAQAFLNVMTTAEYGDLIHRALARPTGSSPPRR